MENNTNTGALGHFILQDAFDGTANGFTMTVNSNTTTENLAFVALYSTVANFGDVFNQFVANANVLSNVHDGGPGGKGIFGIDDGGSTIAFRSVGALPVHISSNVLGSTVILAGYVLATGASNNSVCNTTTMPVVNVTQDSTIPPSPQIPTAGYYELSPMDTSIKESVLLGAGDLVYKDLSHVAITNTTIAFKNRQAIHQDVDYTVTTVAGKSRLTWIGNLAAGQPEALIAGDRISVTYFLNSS